MDTTMVADTLITARQQKMDSSQWVLVGLFILGGAAVLCLLLILASLD